MELIDTHIHLYAEEFSADLERLVKSAQDKGIKRFYMPNIDQESFGSMLQLASRFPGVAIPMIGLHPCYVKEDYASQLSAILGSYAEETFAAVGEIGIDLYWDKTTLELQRSAFLKQIWFAKDNSLPIVIHSRESFDQVFEVLEQEKSQELYGIFHCFSGNLEQAKKAIDLGFKLGIGGVVTFKNSGLDKVVEHLSLEHLVLETDGPYLAPAPHRGKTNFPEYLSLVAEKLASIYSRPIEEIAHITSENARALFKI